MLHSLLKMDVRMVLRLEGLLVLLVACVAYAQLGTSWWWFFGLFLLPDVGMLGYLRGPRWGAFTYNLCHTYVLALGLGVFTWWAAWPLGQALALIWVAHIGFDRAAGYGLKHATAFGDTHLGALNAAVGRTKNVN